MAIDLLSSVNQVQVKHAPETKLKLRIGLHTGEYKGCIEVTHFPPLPHCPQNVYSLKQYTFRGDIGNGPPINII